MKGAQYKIQMGRGPMGGGGGHATEPGPTEIVSKLGLAPPKAGPGCRYTYT